MPTTTADTPQGPTLEEAALRMEGLLDLLEASQGTARDADKDADTDKGDGVAETEAQETTDADEAAGGAKDKAADTEEKTEEGEAEEPQMVTIKVDGKTETVPLEEALQGYQRHRDYSRKTAELANQRRELETQHKAVTDERQTYATMLVALRNQLQAGQEEEPNWDEVYKTDPVGYARRRDEWRDKQDKVAAANYELQRLQTLQQEEHARNLASVVAKGRERMLELNPAWKDSKVWETDLASIVRYAQEVAGYSAEEISQAYDPRAIVTLNKARLYDELMSKKPKPVVSKGPRVASAGASNEANVATRLNAAQQRLAKSGRIEDAAKVFEQII